MLRITLENVQLEVLGAPDGSKILSAIDPQAGIVVQLPLDPEGARTVGNALAAGGVKIVGADALKALDNGNGGHSVRVDG